MQMEMVCVSSPGHRPDLPHLMRTSVEWTVSRAGRRAHSTLSRFISACVLLHDTVPQRLRALLAGCCCLRDGTACFCAACSLSWRFHTETMRSARLRTSSSAWRDRR